MSQESGTTTFSTLSPSNYTVKETNKQSKITYTREFLCSLAKSDLIRIPLDVQLSMSCEPEDACALLSPPCCDSDIRCDKPQPSALKVLDDGINLLHKSVEPYRPPWRYKAIPPLRKQSNDLHDNEKYRSSDFTSEEKAEWESRIKGVHEEKYHADMVKVPKENHWHFNKCTDSEGSSEVFFMSPASGNFKTLQSSSTAIIKQLDASRQPSLTQGSVRCEAFHPSILPEMMKNYSTKHQSAQQAISSNTVNEKHKSVNQIDMSQYPLPMLEKNMHLEESVACSNFNVGHPDRTHHLIKSQEKSRLPTFVSLEDGGNLNTNQFEPIYEKGFGQLQLNDASVYAQGSSPVRIQENNVLVTHVSPLPPSLVEDKKLLISNVGKYESASVHCEAILSINSIKNAVSIGMQNPSSPDLAIQQDFESNTFSFLDENSDPSIELCLPDEDSLTRFDGPFLMPDEETLAVVDGSIFGPKSSPFKPDAMSSSSLCDTFEKLVESILDESSPASDINDPTAHHEAELEGYFHSPQQNCTQFSPNQSLDLPKYSPLTYCSFPSQTICQSYPFSHEELRKVNHDVNHPMFQQMTIADKLHSCSFNGWQTGVTPHLPTYQMASSTRKLNSRQYCNLEYQEPSYCGFMMLDPGSHDDKNSNNEAMVDSLLE